MLDSYVNLVDKFGDDIILLQFGFMLIVSTLFLWLWFSNRRKYHNLKHAIPANVVKSYLDSIIQNSTSLKSQLFRGGGLDLGNIPSVMPVHTLSGGENLGVSGAPSTALLEELNQKKALIAALEAQLASSQNANKELEARVAQLQAQLAAAEAKIKELEALLAQSRTGSGDEALRNELGMVTKERNELRDRLKEFEIIADDLANLKRLQQENEQLKKSLSAQGGLIPQAANAKEDPAPKADVSDLFEDINRPSPAADNKALEDFLSEPAAEVIPSVNNNVADFAAPETAELDSAAPGAAPEAAGPRSDKTPEDLLSEFEKMLG